MSSDAPNPYQWLPPRPETSTRPEPPKHGAAGWWAAAISGVLVLALAVVLVSRQLVLGANHNLAQATATDDNFAPPATTQPTVFGYGTPAPTATHFAESTATTAYQPTATPQPTVTAYATNTPFIFPTATPTFTPTPIPPTPTSTSSSCAPSGASFYDDFSGDAPGEPPSGYLLRGASGAAPSVQQTSIGQILSFPYVGNQYWDSWALESGQEFCDNYTFTVELNFQTSGDRGGLTIAWNDGTEDRIDIQPNIYFQNIEFRITYNGSIPSNPAVTGPGLPRYSMSFNVGSSYWLRVVASSAGPGQGEVVVYWSSDGYNFTPEVTATGLATLDGRIGVSTAGPNMPNVYFQNLSAQQN